jgi:hypothetical protein
MKQIYVLFAILGFSCFSCTFVFFESPQPKNAMELTKFPPEVTGKYSVKIKTYIDTITINDTSVSYNSLMIGTSELKESDKNNVLILDSKSAMLKKTGEYYVLSIKNSESDTLWLVYPFIMRGGNLILHHLLINTKDAQSYISEIREITKLVDISDTSQGYHVTPFTGCIINPTDEEFQLLLDKKLFSKFELKRVRQK